jgi:hypothetical protein
MKECLCPSPCKNTTLKGMREVVYGKSLREWKMLHENGDKCECGQKAARR